MGKRGVLGAMSGVLAVGALGVYIYTHLENGLEPDLPDLAQTREAGKTERVTGSASMKRASEDPQAVSLKGGESFYLGAVFQIQPQSTLQIVTEGNWLVMMEGEGEFIFEDARTNAQRTVHSGVWTVKKGGFHAKPHDFGSGLHSLKIKTPGAEISVEGEIGMRLSELGRGQIWLASGKATVSWNDGRKKELVPRGMEHL